MIHKTTHNNSKQQMPQVDEQIKVAGKKRKRDEMSQAIEADKVSKPVPTIYTVDGVSYERIW